MNFNEIMDLIFGAEWLGTLTQILSGTAMVAISALYAKLKNKLINSENSYAKTIGNMLDKNIEINNKLTEQTELNKELKEQQAVTADAVVNLANIVAMGFLDSKGVTADTKLAIGQALGKLQAVGVDLDKVKGTVDHASEKAKVAVEVVNEIREASEKIIEDSTKVSEGITETSLNIYNEILDNNE